MPDVLRPLALCAYCHEINRPLPTDFCRVCALDLRQQYAVLGAGGLTGLFGAYAPNKLDPATYRKTFNREQMTVLIHEFSMAWDTTALDEFPLGVLPEELQPGPLSPDVYRACLHLGLVPPPTASRVKVAYYTLIKVVHPDKGGSDDACKQVQAAYEQLRQFTRKQQQPEEEAL